MGEVTEGVRQADLVRELGLDARKMTVIRKKHLASSDWWKEGSTVWLTPEGETKLRIWHEAHKTDPQIVSTFIECRVVGPLPNKRWVSIAVDYGDRGTLREPCAIPRRLQGRDLTGKKIRVEVVRDVTGVSYRHEDLATGY